MAILQQPVNNSNPFGDVVGDDLAPAGTYVATVLDIKDEFGVERQKYQSMEMEMVDLTCFLFGYRDAQGAAHRVTSKRMKISGNEKSALFAFLKSMQGRAPQYGWDYCTLKGERCLLTVEHIQRRDGNGVFAAIASLSPVPQGMGQGSGVAVGSGQLAVGSGQFGSAEPRPPVGVTGQGFTGASPVVGTAPSVAAVSVPVTRVANDPIPF